MRIEPQRHRAQIPKSEIRNPKSAIAPGANLAGSDACFSNFGFRISVLLSLCLCVSVVQPLSAHPLLIRFYERTVDVRLSTNHKGEFLVEVRYELELNQFIALTDAQKRLQELKEEPPGKAAEYYEAFTRTFAPVLADKLYANLDERHLELKCVQRSHKINKTDGTLHCTFVFRGSVSAGATERHEFTFWEGTYSEEAGRVLLSLTPDPALNLLAKDEPSAELKARSPADLKIGDEERMRQASATFALPRPAEQETVPPTASTNQSAPSTPAVLEEPAESNSSGLLDLLFDTRRGFALLLAFAVVYGAFHALTPGHGKTLVAAYLVGERGTLGHALLLGVATTLTHTGVVLIIAAVLWFFPTTNAARLQVFLGLGGGFVVAALGFWLLYRRLAGQADHFHIGGGHHHHHDQPHGHHHHHGLADHYHDGHGHAHSLPTTTGPVGVWSLIVLGVSGGIVPCTDAIVMLIVAIGKGYLDRALPLLLAFSAGLAGVLIAVGMLVVTSKRFAGSRFGESRLFRSLPLISALLVTLLGLWLCYDAVHTGIAPAINKP
jgi:nickel/cobalt transporter (NicO) family protein